MSKSDLLQIFLLFFWHGFVNSFYRLTILCKIMRIPKSEHPRAGHNPCGPAETMFTAEVISKLLMVSKLQRNLDPMEISINRWFWCVRNKSWKRSWATVREREQHKLRIVFWHGMSHADFDVPVMSGLPKKDVRLSPWKYMLANAPVFGLAKTLPCRGFSGADQGGNSLQEPPSPAVYCTFPFPVWFQGRSRDHPKGKEDCMTELERCCFPGRGAEQNPSSQRMS